VHVVTILIALQALLMTALVDSKDMEQIVLDNVQLVLRILVVRVAIGLVIVSSHSPSTVKMLVVYIMVMEQLVRVRPVQVTVPAVMNMIQVALKRQLVVAVVQMLPSY